MIGHISDTARCVAWYRAMESRRPDAIFRDPFAERLAGPDGVSIVARMPRGRASAWAMITRMAVFDEIIMGRIREHGADLVLNLTAGLDRRMDPPDGGGPGRVQPAPPNRMPNPSSRPVSELEAPSLSFTIAVFLYQEPFTQGHAVAFGCIWFALFMVSSESLSRRRRLRAEAR